MNTASNTVGSHRSCTFQALPKKLKAQKLHEVTCLNIQEWVMGLQTYKVRGPVISGSGPESIKYYSKKKKKKENNTSDLLLLDMANHLHYKKIPIYKTV